MSEVNKLVVHAGLFHTDDVLCAAMARAINPDVWIVRTNTVEKDDARNDSTNVMLQISVAGGTIIIKKMRPYVRTGPNTPPAACCTTNGRMSSFKRRRDRHILRKRISSRSS